MSDRRRGRGGRALERALARLRSDEGRSSPPTSTPATGAAFRASVDERLRSLERGLDEVKGRVNGLLFLLAGAVAAQFVLRLVE